MSSLSEILSRCHRLGLRVWAEGERIGIAPSELIPPDLLDEIRAAKPVLLPLMRDGQTHQLSADRIPWLHVAKQVCAGEFSGAGSSTIECVFIGLRSIHHPTARAALSRLANEPRCPTDVWRSITKAGDTK